MRLHNRCVWISSDRHSFTQGPSHGETPRLPSLQRLNSPPPNPALPRFTSGLNGGGASPRRSPLSGCCGPPWPALVRRASGSLCESLWLCAHDRSQSKEKPDKASSSCPERGLASGPADLSPARSLRASRVAGLRPPGFLKAAPHQGPRAEPGCAARGSAAARAHTPGGSGLRDELLERVGAPSAGSSQAPRAVPG